MNYPIYLCALLLLCGSPSNAIEQHKTVVTLNTILTNNTNIVSNKTATAVEVVQTSLFSHLPRSPHAIGFSLLGVVAAYFVIKKLYALGKFSYVTQSKSAQMLYDIYQAL